MGVLRSAAHRRAESRFWGVFIIAVHRAFVLGLGARHRGIVDLSEGVIRCVTVFACYSSSSSYTRYMYNDDPLRQPGPHTRSYTPKRWQKPHTRTHTLESDKGHTHILHSKTGGAGWISLRGCIKTDGRKPTPRRQERRE